MPSAASIFTALAGVLAVAGLAIYFFGIPPELKRKMEEKALDTMGENKASYIMKGMHCTVEFNTFKIALSYVFSPIKIAPVCLPPSNRSNFQDPSIRPKRGQGPQEGHFERRRWCAAEPVGQVRREHCRRRDEAVYGKVEDRIQASDKIVRFQIPRDGIGRAEAKFMA